MDVAFRVPTTAGVPSSLLTIAAWQVIPPSSVTIAATFCIAGTMSGFVIFVTRMSPALTDPVSLTSRITTTRPVATPGDAPWPLTRIFPSPVSVFTEVAPDLMVVMGRDWRM